MSREESSSSGKPLSLVCLSSNNCISGSKTSASSSLFRGYSLSVIQAAWLLYPKNAETNSLA